MRQHLGVLATRVLGAVLLMAYWAFIALIFWVGLKQVRLTVKDLWGRIPVGARDEVILGLGIGAGVLLVALVVLSYVVKDLPQQPRGAGRRTYAGADVDDVDFDDV